MTNNKNKNNITHASKCVKPLPSKLIPGTLFHGDFTTQLHEALEPYIVVADNKKLTAQTQYGAASKHYGKYLNMANTSALCALTQFVKNPLNKVSSGENLRTYILRYQGILPQLTKKKLTTKTKNNKTMTLAAGGKKKDITNFFDSDDEKETNEDDTLKKQELLSQHQINEEEDLCDIFGSPLKNYEEDRNEIITPPPSPKKKIKKRKADTTTEITAVKTPPQKRQKNSSTSLTSKSSENGDTKYPSALGSFFSRIKHTVETDRDQNRFNPWTNFAKQYMESILISQDGWDSALVSNPFVQGALGYAASMYELEKKG